MSTKKGFAMGIGVWSVASIASGLVSTASQFAVVRAVLELGEAANFPSSALEKASMGNCAKIALSITGQLIP